MSNEPGNMDLPTAPAASADPAAIASAFTGARRAGASLADFPGQIPADVDRFAHPGHPVRGIGGIQFGNDPAQPRIERRIPQQLCIGADQLQFARAARHGAGKQHHAFLLELRRLAFGIKRQIDQIADLLAQRLLAEAGEK